MYFIRINQSTFILNVYIVKKREKKRFDKTKSHHIKLNIATHCWIIQILSRPGFVLEISLADDLIIKHRQMQSMFAPVCECTSLYFSLPHTSFYRLMLPAAFWRKTAQLTATAWGREVGGLCGLAEHPKKLMVLSPLGSICHCVCLLRACAKTMQRSVPECFPHKCFSHPIRWNDYFIALFYHTGL